MWFTKWYHTVGQFPAPRVISRNAIPVSLKWWWRQQWNFSPLTSPVSTMDFSMGTLLRRCPSSRQWKQTGMIHLTSIWIRKGLWDESLHLRRWGSVSKPSGNNTNTSKWVTRVGNHMETQHVSNGNKAAWIFTSLPKSLDFIFKFVTTCISPFFCEHFP